MLFRSPHPTYGHVPLLTAPDGRRLSKRDKDLDLGQLRQHVKPEEILGILAYSAGILDIPTAISAKELIPEFSWKKLGKQEIPLNGAMLERLLALF